MKITLWGNTPSKKNDKIMVFSKKRIIKLIKEYQDVVSSYSLQTGTMRVYDMENILSAILDVVEKTKPIMISNKNYYDWFKKNKILLENNIEKFTDSHTHDVVSRSKYAKVDKDPILVQIDLYRKTKHRCDWNNISHAITDLLVAVDILEDDDTIHCKPIFGDVYYDKENPRAEIEIFT